MGQANILGIERPGYPSGDAEASPRPPTGRPRARIDFIDGLRAVCAVYVLLDHAYMNVLYDKHGGALSPSVGQAAQCLGYGFWAVAVFIILSGYCLMLPVVRSPDLSLKGGTTGYLKRRARRILPPYYAALGLSLLVLGLAPGLCRPTGHFWDNNLPAFSVGGIVSHLLLIHDLKPEWIFLINGPMWSIAVEWQIYFLMPLLLLPAFRRFGWPACIASGFLLAWILRVVTHSKIEQAQPLFIGLFAIGMAAASLGSSRTMRRPFGNGFWACAGIALLLLNIGQQRCRQVWVARHTEWIALALVGMSVGCLLILLSRQSNSSDGRRSGLPLGILQFPPLVRVGMFSYSLYLIHFPIMALAYLWLGAQPMSPDLRLATMLFVVAPTMIPISYFFYVIFERPFMSSGPSGGSCKRPVAPAAP